jgi:osmotically-inducible protein OsmY
MATANLTSADVRLRGAVTRQLEWDPEFDAAGIGVAVHGAAVTLTGFIDTYAGKLAAERAAKRVQGVRAVANDIEVRARLDRNDADIAQDTVQALRFQTGVPEGVQATVHIGHVTLTGPVEWLYQKEAAERAVRHVRGVRGVRNYIAVAARNPVKDVQRQITRALHRHADIDASRISVEVQGQIATLNGTVGSWLQREAAEHAAGQAPGISAVDNRISVVPGEVPSEDVDEIC